MPIRPDAGPAGSLILPALTCLTLGLLACSEGSADGARVANTIVRDSAGIEIVENAIPDDAPAVIEVGTEPRLSIGAIEGDEASQLHRVQGGVRLPDGRLALLNAGTFEVRIYRPDGTLDTRFGSQGDGPGEFEFPNQLMSLPPDTLAVFDLRSWEVSRFLDDGTLIGETPGRSAYQDLVPEGLIAESGFAVPHSGLILQAFRSDQLPPVGQPFRPEIHLLFVSRDSTMRELYEPGGLEQVMLQTSMGRPMSGVILYGERGTTAHGGRPFRVWTGRTGRYELRQFDGEGSLLRIVRADPDPLTVTDADVERSREQARTAIADAPAPEEQKKIMLELALGAPAADTWPLFGSVYVSVDGGAWITRMRRPPENPADSVAAYDVFGPDGRWQGVAYAPRGMQPLEIGADYLLGVRRDELGVEHVELYDLAPAPTAPAARPE